MHLYLTYTSEEHTVSTFRQKAFLHAVSLNFSLRMNIKYNDITLSFRLYFRLVATKKLTHYS